MKESFSIYAEAAVASDKPFGGAFKDVWRLLKKGIDIASPGEQPLQAELRELAAPHMAVLVHKRTKVSEKPGALEDERWFGELGDFVSRMLWPYLETSAVLDGRSKNCVAELLDEIVAAEQRQMAELALVDLLPRTSRFDASWAT